MNEEEINKAKENMEKGLLPCGCEKKKCSCTISALEYVQKYSSVMGQAMKGNSGAILKNKRRTIQQAFKIAKGFVKK